MTAQSTMCVSRLELASLILSRGARVNGEPVDVGEPRFELLSTGLTQTGVRAGEVVVLHGLQGRDVVLAALAIWRLDAVPMPVLNNSAVSPGVPDAHRITKDLTVVPGTSGCRMPGLGTTAVLHMSSGSTAQPKVVKRGIESVLLEAEGYRAGLSLVPADCVAVPIPLFHSLGWGVAMSALINGCSLDVNPLVRIDAVAARIESGAVSVLALTAPVARLLATTQSGGRANLRAAMVGAGPVTEDLDEAFRARFERSLLRGYGSTETGGTFLGNRGIGKPVPGVEILRPAPGERGELVLRLAAPVEGYLDGSTGPSQEWSTGDVVQHDRDGVVHFAERLRGGLRLNGRFVNADIVEKALRSAPGVTDVYLLVLSRRQTPEIEDFYAVVEGGDGGPEALSERLAHSGAESPLPRIVHCARIPRTVIGKPDRSALIDMVRKEYAVV
jgi:acyl-CoA synthetase (AMP-forming)/AMP-acid ligase II